MLTMVTPTDTDVRRKIDQHAPFCFNYTYTNIYDMFAIQKRAECKFISRHAVVFVLFLVSDIDNYIATYGKCT